MCEITNHDLLPLAYIQLALGYVSRALLFYEKRERRIGNVCVISHRVFGTHDTKTSRINGNVNRDGKTEWVRISIQQNNWNNSNP